MSVRRSSLRTYVPADGTPLPDLSRLPGVHEVVQSPVSTREETFFDTAGHDLVAARIPLVLRTGTEHQGWSLGLPARRRRKPLRVPLGRNRRTPPKRLRTMVTAWTLGESLSAAAVVTATRTDYELVGAERAVLATVSVHDVRCVTTVAGDRSDAWQEVTVEPVGAEPQLLHALDVAMDDVSASRAVRPRSGLDILAELVAGAEPVAAPRPKGPSGRVLAARLEEQLVDLRLRDAEARADDGGVHGLRVALRRLSAALATWRPLVEREITDPLRDELRWAAHELGGSRDAEVADALVSTLLDAEPDDLVLGPVRRRVEDDLAARRRETRRHTRTVLESDRYVDLVRRLSELVAAPPWTDVADRPAREVLPRLIRKDWKRLRRSMRAVEADHGGAGHAEALHAVRKAAKRLRYAAETLQPVDAPAARRLSRRAKKVQSLLGRHRDTVVARARLVRLAHDAQEAGESAFTYGRFHQRLEIESHAHLAAYEQAARRVPKPQL